MTDYRPAKPILIAHRGASGYLPEHTLAAYRMAIEQGADFIEPDLVSTADGVLIARHENEIGGIHGCRFPSGIRRSPDRQAHRRRARDRLVRRGFTLAEIKTLRARERVPGIRPHNARFDGLVEIPSFEEVLNLVLAMNERRARDALVLGRPRPSPIGLYPETKHASYFRDLGLPLEARLIDSLERHGYGGPDALVFSKAVTHEQLPELGMQAVREQLLLC